MKKIKRLFLNVNMGLGHNGLASVARDHKIEPSALGDEELLLYINRRMNKLKILGGGGLVIGYYRTRGEEKMMLEAIQYLPQTFGAKGFDYNAAVEKALKTRFAAIPNKMKKSVVEAVE